MTTIYPGRYAADMQATMALFLVGMRINKPLRIRSWWPAFAAMSRMLRQLQADPDLGLWHEAYVITPRQTSSLYRNMPRIGLAAATSHVPLGPRHSSHDAGAPGGEPA